VDEVVHLVLRLAGLDVWHPGEDLAQAVLEHQAGEGRAEAVVRPTPRRILGGS
jgi:hypothetical protein